jgi:hypothetical protein
MDGKVLKFYAIFDNQDEILRKFVIYVIHSSIVIFSSI